MFVKNISLKKFKCFEDIDLEFKKITLLTGQNSSGKSSLLYGLLAPFQSLDFPFYLSPNGKYVNLGDFNEMVFRNLKDEIISINFEIFDDSKELFTYKTNWILESKTKMPKLKNCILERTSMKVIIECNKTHDYDVEIHFDMNSTPKETLEKIDQFAKLVMSQIKSVDDDKESSDISIIIPEPITKFTVNDLDYISYKLRKNQYFYLWFLYLDFVRNINAINDRINFISSFRLQPERTYFQKTKSEDKVGVFGENYIDQIYNWKNRNPRKFSNLKKILKNLDLIDNMMFKKLGGGRVELKLQVNKSGIWASLPDVGFGVSQFLPIIVADLQLPKKSILLIAQPEIHLHPSIQADLADYFISQTINNGKHYIIESHSEYLLNRFRLGIVNGVLKPEDIAVYYFENSESGTKKHEILLTSDGQIKNAPKEFFDTYMVDVMDIALNS